MLSGEGNENGEKTTIGLISKKKTNFARAAHFFCTFLCRCFVRPRETSRNFLVTRFMEEMLWFTFFRSLIFTLHWWLQAFVTTATKFPTKKNVSFVFLSLALNLCLPFTR